MAKKRNRNTRNNDGNILFTGEQNVADSAVRELDDESRSENGVWANLGQGERIVAIAVCFLLVAGALGATGIGSSIVSVFTQKKSAQTNNQSARNSSSSLSASLNPFVDATPTPTPMQLSKEYLYAGSRILAVEDANASAAPPADLAVWRPSSGNWYVINSSNSNQQYTTAQWGSSGDLPVPGDYDGDGKTDFAIFKPSTNYWWISYSSTGNYITFPFGQANDIVIGASYSNGIKSDAADFDGDGKTDAAVFRPANGLGYWFYVRSSDQTVVSFQFGLSSDIPIAKDFDGDGKADVTVWRESNGAFYTVRSSDNSLQTQGGGQAGDKQVSADYDGDGKADYAVRRGADWIYVQSSNSQVQQISWQQSGDKEVQNDYDGDGKVDIAVWRESTGMWYIRQSSHIGQSNELRQVQWGQTGDTPVPAFYRR